MSNCFGFSNIIIPVTGLTYKGLWDADSNVPFLESSVGTSGDYYIVAKSGTTNLNGITDWQENDWAIFNGGVWQKIDNSQYTPTLQQVTQAGNDTTGNIYANNYFEGFSSITASGTLITLTVNSKPSYIVIGSGGQTFKLPNATTLPNGAQFFFNNNQSSGSILVNNNSSTLVKSIPSGAYLILTLIDNTIAAGSWDTHFEIPSNVSWSTNTFDYAGSFTSGTWNGNTVEINRGGTGASTAAGALSNLGGVPTTRNITVNGTTADLSANRTFTVTDANLSTSDITTNDVSITKHGFAPKAPNDTSKFLRGDGTWASVGASSGIFGISNASGVYTYYATLTLAMAAATSGQVIEMFADVTESVLTTVTLKDGVIIQGNGHTYTYSGNTGNVFATPSGSGTYTFVNMNIKRANTATSTGVIFYGGSGFAAAATLKFIATTVTYTTTTGTAKFTANDSLCSILIDGINAIGNTESGTYMFGSAFEYSIKNSIIENTGAGNCISSGNITGGCSYENCFIKTNSGIGIFCNFPADSIRNCTGISSTGNALGGQSGASAYDCFAFSNTNKAFSGLVCYNCTGQTTTGNAFYAGAGFNVTGKSTTGYTVKPFFAIAKFYNSSFYSSGSIPCYDDSYQVSLYNCSVITDYNNAAGSGVQVNGTPEIVNTFIQVANTSANCIKGSVAITAKVTNNVFKGATTPINANVTLSAVTIDATYNNTTL